nr:glycosyltransferase [uncultured Pedobacter sp.]
MCKISVVMAVYNAEQFLQEAVESILNQTFKEFEFIIINDGSTDNSLNIIKSYNDQRIILVNQANQGLSKSLNNGVAIAKSELIVRMDADDISDVNRLKMQYHYMENIPNCVILGTNASVIDLNGSFLYSSNLPLEDEKIRERLPESSFFHSSTIFRKDCFLKVGGYPEDIFHYFEDKVLWNKMAPFGELKNLSEPLIKYRLVPGSISNLPHKKIAELKKIANTIIQNNYVFNYTSVQKINEITSISRRKKSANYYLRIGTIYLKSEKRLIATISLIKSLFYYPFNLNTLIKLVACFFPYPIIKKIGNR